MSKQLRFTIDGPVAAETDNDFDKRWGELRAMEVEALLRRFDIHNDIWDWRRDIVRIMDADAHEISGCVTLEEALAFREEARIAVDDVHPLFFYGIKERISIAERKKDGEHKRLHALVGYLSNNPQYKI